MKSKKIAVLLTCFNRKQDTLNCLRALFDQVNIDDLVSLDIYLVDDGSTDGTEVAVKQMFPQVNIILGDGNLFWNGGMHKAFSVAIKTDYHYYLWLNDDTVLEPDVVQRLVNTSIDLAGQGQTTAIIAGATCSAETGTTTYSGVCRQYWWWPLRFSLVEPQSKPVRCDTMSGNCVLIPREVVRLIGNLDDSFKHYLGDYDYGLRASKQGASVWLAPGYIGTCNLSKLERRKQVKIDFKNVREKLEQPKGLAIADTDLTSLREWKVFSKRHGGYLWPIYWIAPYRRLLFASIFSR